MSSEIFNIQNYKEQLDFANNLIGQEILKVNYYLDDDEITFSEQPNKYGHSLLNGIDIQTVDFVFSIYNGFCDGMGLKMGKGKTTDFEFLSNEKSPKSVSWNVINDKITKCKIYWSKIIYNSHHGFYPQEIEIWTENNSVLVSSTEILHGELDDEFTNEMLIIQNQEHCRKLNLGKFGIINNGREIFENTELMEKKTGYNIDYGK